MSTFKRCISLLLVLGILLGVLAPAAQAAPVEDMATLDAGAMTIEGTNGFGTLLSQEIQESQEESASAEEDYEAGYSIIDLTFDGAVATVEYSSLEESRLVVAVYSEDGLQMLASGETTVSPDEDVATVTIEGDMPEYFMASAYLVDTYDMSPLCVAYDTPMYTQDMQELLESTVDDYDPERVLNLDEDETTNFAVYADDTIVIDAAEGVNTVASIDEESATYVIENADEQFTSLQEGDVLVYPYGENEMLIAKVGSVSVDGTTVTITGADLEMVEVFSHVKITDSGETEDFEFDDTGTSEGVSFVGIHSKRDDATVSTAATAGTTEYKKYAQFTLDHTLDKTTPGALEGEMKLTGTLNLSLGVSLEYYSVSSKQHVEVRLYSEAEISIAIDAEVKLTLPLVPAKYSNLAVEIGFEPEFIVEVGAEVSFKVTFVAEIVLTFGWDDFDIRSKGGYDGAELSIEGTLFVGIDLNPVVKVAKGYLADLDVEMPAGLEIKGTRGGSQYEIQSENVEIRHDCEKCLDIDFSLIVEYKVKWQFLKSKWLKWEIGDKVSWELQSMYLSLDNEALGVGGCPYKSYRVVIGVKLLDYLPNITVSKASNNGKLTELGVTDENGLLMVYLPEEQYEFVAKVGNSYLEKTQSITSACKILLDNSTIDEGRIFHKGIIESEEIIDDNVVVLNGQCGDNLFWNLDNKGRLIISGTGPMWNYGYAEAPWYSLHSSITSLWIGSHIGDKVTSIGDYAFAGCDILTSVEMGGNVTSIGNYAFKGCASLANIEIPNSVITIGDEAFYECPGLTNVTIGNGVTSLNGFAFAHGYSLKNVTIGNSVTAIGNEAFYDCPSLIRVTIGNAVTSIGDYAFKGCTSLSNIEIPDNVTTIGVETFYDCPSLTSVTIGDGVTSLRSFEFARCNSLRSVTIGASVTAIGDETFYDCPNLTSVKIGNSVTTIGDDAFQYCTSLSSVTLPDSIITIGVGAFDHCTSLTNITIPDSVTTIGDVAFAYCISMTEIIFRGDAPTTTNRAGGAFYASDLVAYYPAGNSTWTADAMAKFDFSTTIWVPYTLDENGDMITNAADAVTTAAELGDIDAPDASDTETVIQTGLEVPTLDFGDRDAPLNPNAVYDGEYSTIVTDTYTLKTASFSGLIPGAQYILLAMVSIDVEDPLAADNLLYIDQAAALEDGTLVFQYVQRTPTETSYVVACGASGKDLNDAEITFPEMVVDGETLVVSPTVVYDGKTLTEGQDYTIQGTVSVTEPGTYTCYIRGIRNYSGLVECTYAVINPYKEVAFGFCGDNMTWTFYDNGRLTISGMGEMTEFNSYSSVPWNDRRSSILTVIIEDGVTTIGDFAFADCVNLTGVMIGESVTVIGDGAFHSCSNLTSVEIPDGVTTIGSLAYYDCTSLSSVTIGDSVTAIGSQAFQYCDSLTDVIIGEKVTRISNLAFSNCSKLTSVEIPDSVTTIGYGAFRFCSRLTSMAIPDSVTTIGNYAFMSCTNLTIMELPNSVTTIGDYVFSGCTSLSKVTFMGDAPVIGEGAFSRVTATVYYPVNNPTWNENVLQNYSGTITWLPCCAEHSYEVVFTEPTCTEQGSTTYLCSECGYRYVEAETEARGHNYETVVSEPTCTEQGYTTYICSTCGDSYVADKTEALGHTYESVVTEDGELTYFCITCGDSYTDAILASLEYVVYEDHVEITSYTGSETELVIPSEIEGMPVTIIGEEAFYDCTRLISVTIPYSVTTISNYAFSYCESLTSMTIPYGVTTIGASAFRYCTSLTSVEIPNSVTAIGNYAFRSCTNLSQITFMGNAPVITGEAFYNVTATAYYRANNHTWTENLRQNYGGTITWVAYTSECTDHSFEAAVTKPTCTVQGYTTYTCPKCGDSYVTDETEALGHIYESTITEDGELNYTCFTCGDSYTEATLATLMYTVYEDHVGITGYTGSADIVVIPAEIEGLPVTAIESYAFWNCTSLESVTIPDGVTVIGFGAFQNCWWMSNVTIPESVTSIGNQAFMDCESLTSVNIPDGVTSIGERTFNYCTNLKSIDIPDSVTSIGYKAFEWCVDLSSVTIPNGVTRIDTQAFFHCISLSSITIPDSVGYIADNAFGECTSLRTIYFDGHAPTVAEDSFSTVVASAYYFANLTSWTQDVMQDYGGTITWVGLGDPVPLGLYFKVHEDHVEITDCHPSLAEVVIPAEIDRLPVTVICDEAFKYNDGVTSIAVPESVTYIGDSAFEGCSNLTTINIPDSVTYIGKYAFMQCDNLTGTINIPDGITHIGDYAFYCCYKLTGSVTIPVSLTSMGTGVFASCDSLTGITIQDGVATIVDQTFSGCDSITSIKFPASVTSIGERAFEYCHGLTSITIPDSIHSIGAQAFDYCSKLKTIRFLGDAPEFGKNVFSGVYGSAYYPGDNPTWTTEVMENCEDYSINWVAEGEVFGMEIVSAPEYGIVGLAPDLSELCVELVYGNDIHRPVANSKLTISDIDTTTVGKKNVTVSYDDFSVEFAYGVHEATGVVLDPSLYPESAHDYGGNRNETEILTWPGADCLELVFSEASSLDWLDHIRVYDGKDNRIAWYSGSNATGVAGVTLMVPGDTVKIEFISETGTGYGYSFTSITAKSALHTGSVTIPAKEATCTEPGWTEGFICEICDCEQYTVIPALGHEYKSMTIAPTCTEQGYTTHTCICGDSYQDNYTPATGHSYSYKATKVPTISATGTLTGTCSKCSGTTTVPLPKLNTTDYTYEVTKEATCTAAGTGRYTWKTTIYGSFHFDVSIAAAGHSYTASVTHPTCTEKGYTTYCCHCGDRYISDYIDPLGHNMGEWTISNEATCTLNGLEIRECSRCDHSETRTINALGHDWNDGVVIREPTEETEGERLFSCTACGATKTESIPVIGHEHSYEAVVTAPTCTEQGYTTYTCRCGDSYTADYVNALGHDMGEWRTVTGATCTEEGVEQCNCSRCDYIESRTIEAAGHSWDKGIVTREPTEDIEGERLYTCTACGATKTESIPVIGHEHSYETVVTAPTCTEQGYTTYTCKCGESYTADYVAALSHSFGEWVVITEPTTTEEGMEERSCTRCGHTEQRIIAKLENPFNDVAPGSFYYDPVMWAIENGITNGTSATTFGPNDQCMRAHVVTFLWRAVGCPEPTKTDNPFVDVKPTDFYYKPVLWAVENGITSGMDATHFGPTAYCNRAQVVTFLYRTVGSPAVDASKNPFTDVPAGQWFTAPVLWAVENGITNGLSATTFGPNTICNRAQIVTFLYRAFVND